MEDKQSRWKSILAIEKQLNQQFKTPHSLIRLGDKVGTLLPSFATDLLTLDYEVIQTGGIPKGRIIEFFGAESGGKTSLALHIAAKVQQAGGIVAFVDAEHAIYPSYAAKLGVDLDELLISQPDNAEQALETVEALVGQADLIIVDSVAALVPQAELDGEMGDAHIGLQARLMSQAMRKLTGKLSKSGTSCIFINQIREKIGVMFGNPETTAGGRALKFYASVRLRISRTQEQVKEGDELVGHVIKVSCVKNKVGTPFKDTLVTLNYNTGFDTALDAMELAVQRGIVEQSGAWFSFDGGDKVQGKKALFAMAGDKIQQTVKKVIEAESK